MSDSHRNHQWSVRWRQLSTERNLDAARVQQRQEASTVKATGNMTNNDSIMEQHYANDRIVTTLEIDYQARIRGYQCAFFRSACCICPMLSIPTNLICCSTLYLCTCFPKQERGNADAHRLVLRERSLLYEVDEHISVGSDVGSIYDQGLTVPLICHACGGGVKVDKHKQVIPLQQVSEVRLESGKKSCCQEDGGPDQLLVIGGMGGVVAAIAGPKDAQGFIDKVEAQKRCVTEQGLDEDAPDLPMVSAPGDVGGISSIMGAMMSMANQMQGGGQGGVFMSTGGGASAPQGFTMQRNGFSAGATLNTGSNVSDQLTMLASMYKDGLLTKEEFETAKAKLLNSL